SYSALERRCPCSIHVLWTGPKRGRTPTSRRRRVHALGITAVAWGDPLGNDSMLLVSTYVAQSRIEGVGVFAARPIRAGEIIWKLDPDFDRLVAIERYESAPPHLRELLERYAYPSPDRPGMLVYEV